MNDHVAPLVPIVFPPNPAIGDTYDAPSGVTYVWDGAVWTVTGGGVAPPVDLTDYVQKAGDTMTGQLTLQYNSPILQLDKGIPAGNPGIQGSYFGQPRWAIVLGDQGPEGGANLGSNFSIARYADNGAFIDIPFYVNRATGETTFIDTVSSPVVPTQPFNLINLAFLQDAALGYVPIAGNAATPMTGELYLFGDATNAIGAVPLQQLEQAIDDLDLDNTYVKKAGDIMTGNLTIRGTLPILALNSPVGPAYNGIVGSVDNINRWVLDLGDGTVEAGANSGSDFQLGAYSDTGNLISTPLAVQRATGIVTFGNQVILPLQPTQNIHAANKQYVDQRIASIVAFQGIWQVWLNNPDLITLTPNGGDYWIAETEDPLVPDIADAGIPGIGGATVAQGDLIFFSQADNEYHLLGGTGGGLTKPEADLLYVAVAGDIMTGSLTLNADPTLAMQAATKQYVDLNSGLVPIGLNPPAAPSSGQLWWRSDPDGQLYIFYNDGNSSQWVTASPGGSSGGGGGLTKLEADTYYVQLGGSTMTGTLLLSEDPTVDMGAATKQYVDLNTGTPPFDGRVYAKRDGLWIDITRDLFEPPNDGNIYGRETNDWQPVLPITGGTLQGPLTLANDPVNPNNAATKQYVDQFFSGTAILTGIINAATGQCTFIDETTGGLPAPTGSRSYYICTIAGTIPSGPAVGITMRIGDELYDANNNTWVLIAVGSTPSGAPTADQIAVVPSVAGATNVQAALTNIQAQKLALTGGALTGKITTPATADADAATTVTTKGYVDGKIASGSDVGAWQTIAAGGLWNARSNVNVRLINGGANVQVRALLDPNTRPVPTGTSTAFFLPGTHRPRWDGSTTCAGPRQVGSPDARDTIANVWWVASDGSVHCSAVWNTNNWVPPPQWCFLDIIIPRT